MEDQARTRFLTASNLAEFNYQSFCSRPIERPVTLDSMTLCGLVACIEERCDVINERYLLRIQPGQGSHQVCMINTGIDT
jgi:hypothetical protein